MSHKAILTVDGESRTLLTYHHNYYRQKGKMKSFDTQSFFNTPIACDLRNGYRFDDFEHFSEPLAQVFGGMFYVSFEATDKDDLFYYWMKNSAVLDGRIEFYRTVDEDDIPFQRINFWDAFLVRIKEQVIQGSYPMTMECDISAAIVRHNRNDATLLRKSWYVTDINEKPISGNNEEVEENIERLLIRKVKGSEDAKPGEKVKYKVTQYNRDAVTNSDKQSICWAVRLNDGSQISLPESEYKGEEIELEIKDEWGGKEILVIPYLNKPWEKVSQKTKVSFKYVILQIEFIDGLTEGSDNVTSTGTQKGVAYGNKYKIKVKEYRDNEKPENPKIHWEYCYKTQLGFLVTKTLKEDGEEITFECNSLDLCGCEIEFFAYINDKKTEASLKVFHHYRFLYISRNKVKDDINKITTNKGKTINQKGTSLCGIASLLYLFAKNKPNLYEKFILDLHRIGEGTHALYTAKPGIEIIKRKQTGYDTVNSLSLADYIGLTSLRNSENKSYKGGNEQFHAINWPWTMTKLSKQFLGYSQVKHKGIYNPIKPLLIDIPETKIEIINNYVLKGYELVLMIDSDLIDDGWDADQPDYHWIVLESDIRVLKKGVLKGSDVIFKAYSWGNVKEYTMTLSHFSRNYYGYIALK